MKEPAPDFNNRNPIGAGGEKTVYNDPTDPNRIEAVYRIKRSNEEIKATYYFSKLLYLLFPEGVPQIYRAGNKKEEHGGVSAYIADKVEISEPLRRLAEINKRYYLEKKDVRRFPHGFLLDEGEGDEAAGIEDLFYKEKRKGIQILKNLEALEKKGPYSAFPDTGNAGNVSSFEQDAKYLDLSSPFEVGVARVSWKIDPSELLRLIENMSDDKKKIANTYYSRMLTLYQEAESKIKSHADRPQ